MRSILAATHRAWSGAALFASLCGDECWRLLPFAELVFDQGDERVHRLGLVFSLGLDVDVGADAGGQPHDAPDAFCIDAPAVAAHVTLTAEASRELGELGRRARV